MGGGCEHANGVSAPYPQEQLLQQCLGFVCRAGAGGQKCGYSRIACKEALADHMCSSSARGSQQRDGESGKLLTEHCLGSAGAGLGGGSGNAINPAAACQSKMGARGCLSLSNAWGLQGLGGRGGCGITNGVSAPYPHKKLLQRCPGLQGLGWGEEAGMRLSRSSLPE